GTRCAGDPVDAERCCRAGRRWRARWECQRREWWYGSWCDGDGARSAHQHQPDGRVEGELAGFRKFTRDKVDVSVNTTVRVDIALSVGELEESVTVTGEAPMLQTDRTDTGRIIEST